MGHREPVGVSQSRLGPQDVLPVRVCRSDCLCGGSSSARRCLTLQCTNRVWELTAPLINSMSLCHAQAASKLLTSSLPSATIDVWPHAHCHITKARTAKNSREKHRVSLEEEEPLRIENPAFFCYKS